MCLLLLLILADRNSRKILICTAGPDSGPWAYALPTGPGCIYVSGFWIRWNQVASDETSLCAGPMLLLPAVLTWGKKKKKRLFLFPCIFFFF